MKKQILKDYDDHIVNEAVWLTVKSAAVRVKNYGDQLVIQVFKLGEEDVEVIREIAVSWDEIEEGETANG